MNSHRIDAYMAMMQPQWRYRWCTAALCACLGCANAAGDARKFFTKAEWEDWKARHPERKA